MKHLITKLLLVLAIVLGVSVAQAADFYLVGEANAIGNENVVGFQPPGTKLTTDANGDVYFWATGGFKLSTNNSSSWNDGDASYNKALIKIFKDGKIECSSSDNGNSEAANKYVKLHYNGGDLKTSSSYSVTTQDTPFEEGGGGGDEDLADLYIGGGWNDSWFKPAPIVVENNAYTDFKITATGDFQFRFYTIGTNISGSDKTGWMGASYNNFICTADGSAQYSTVSNTGEVFNVKNGAGVYVVHIVSFDKANKKVTFTINKEEVGTDYKFYFRSNLNDPNWKNDFELTPGEDGTTTFKLSNVAGKSFGIQGAQNNIQKLWYVPADADDRNNIGTAIRSYSLLNVEGQGDITAHFSDNAPAGDYTFVLEWNDEGFPSVLRVNPPLPEGYNQTLYVGIASANRHQIILKSDGTYDEYKFYVNDEDIEGDSEFGFRFYSEPNAGTWMGNDEFGISFGTEKLPFDTECTTKGIKRYFIKESGAYAINVSSYDPVNNKVTFTLKKLEGVDIVRDPLYIGFSSENNLALGNIKDAISSSHGKYNTYTVTVPDKTYFAFFSKQTGGQQMGPVYSNKLHVDGDGTGSMPFTTVGTDRVFTIHVGGTYEINVSDYNDNNNKVAFTVKRVSEPQPYANIPATLNIRCNRDNWTKVIPMNYDAAGKKFTTTFDYPAGEDFKFQLVEKDRDYFSGGIVAWPDAQDTRIWRDLPACVENFQQSGDPNKAWWFRHPDAQKITVIVNFSEGYPTVEFRTDKQKKYYFIGDLNNWFSTEFEGEVNQNNPQMTTDGLPVLKSINEQRFLAERDKWAFEPDPDREGWYIFSKFPNSLLSGHFQIISGTEKTASTDKTGDLSEGNSYWNCDYNEIYSHVVCVDGDAVSEGQNSTYRAFKKNRITRDDILNGKEYRVRRRKTQFQSGGSNLGTQCNAVKEAAIHFYPGSGVEAPRIIIDGFPEDYFIFYNMSNTEEAKTEADKKGSGTETDEYWVRAAINSGKPNTNNYFLAGIKYGNYTLPYIDINGNTGAHMNVGEGIDLAPYNLAEMSEAEIGNLFFHQKELVKCFYTDHKKNKEIRLPNGRLIADENGVKYDKVWIAKVPSGFENPAGTKYNMTFNKAMTEADRNSTRTLTPRHYYFFPQEAGLHVHINTDEITELTNVASVDVAYRLYKTDNSYNTITVFHGSDVEGGRQTKRLNDVGSVIPMTAGSATENLGWYPCTRLSKKFWDNPTVPGYTDDEWFVSWIPDAAAPAADTETTVPSGSRREVAYDDNMAFVQFRMTIHLKQPINAAPGRRNEPISSYTVYVPERVDVANDEYHFSFNNQDLYVRPEAGEGSDGVWTGLREVLDEINGNVDPSSVETVYYNLQGVRVDNPTEGGVYIRVRGDKSDKVLF